MPVSKGTNSSGEKSTYKGPVGGSYSGRTRDSKVARMLELTAGGRWRAGADRTRALLLLGMRGKPSEGVEPWRGLFIQVASRSL